MLILPPGHHAQTIGRRRAFRRREKWMMGGVLGVVTAFVVVLVISFSSETKKSGRGCISVALAYSTGGEQIYRCGVAARALCAGVGKVGGITGNTGRTVATACRQAGVPIG
jgi:hypothetical protein